MPGHVLALDFSVHDLQCRLIRVSTMIPAPHVKHYSHNHSMPELHYVRDGQCTFLVENTPYTVCAGQLLLIPPGPYHYIRELSENLTRLAISIQFRLPAARQNSSFSGQAFAAFTPPAPLLLDVPASSTLANILSQMNTLSGSSDLVPREKLRALSQLLVLELFEQLPHAQSSAIPISSAQPTLQNYTIDEFFVHSLRLNNGEALLAKRLNVSTRQLNRILKQSYGMNYREKLKEARLKLALEQLCHTDSSISQIAQQLGYSSAANFNTFIKNVTGKTPTQLRRESRTFL